MSRSIRVTKAVAVASLFGAATIVAPAANAAQEPSMTITLGATVTGKTVAENLRELDPEPIDGQVIHRFDDPIHVNGGITVLHGSLAPEGAVVKSAGFDADVFDRHLGRPAAAAFVQDSQSRSRRGVVRLHPEAIAALGIREWDAISLTGSRTTAAVVGIAPAGTPTGTALLDDVTLSNAGLREDTSVLVAPVTVYGARSVTLSGSRLATQSISAATLRQALLGKVMTVGDTVSLLPRDLGPGTSTSAASANRRSVAPGSSGLGKATVGKSGSGANCDATMCTSSIPANASASSANSPPTPCSGVNATRTEPVVRRTFAACSR